MSGGGKGSKKVVVGHHYHMNIHFALTNGSIDELLEIRVGDRSAWKGSVAGDGSALISQVNLFGGEEREGGVWGVVDVMTGSESTPPNPVLKEGMKRQFEAGSLSSVRLPAYRGITTAYFRGLDETVVTGGTPWSTANSGELDEDKNEYAKNTSFSMSNLLAIAAEKSRNNFGFYWAAMNPYFKIPKFRVRRRYNSWYSAKAHIGDDANPAHIIYECLRSRDWGLGYNSSDINSSNFESAADTLHDEGFGLSLIWSNQSTVEEFIEDILDHIDASLVENRITGEWELRLIRGGYDVSSLPSFDETNCELENFNRKTLSDTVNEVIVSYTVAETGETDTVVAHDIANFTSQGRISSQKKEYPGINNAGLASRVAQRDLQVLSSALAGITIHANRDAYNLYPGDLIKFSWARHGISGAAFRITSVNLGNIGSNTIIIEAVEDVFSLPAEGYTTDTPVAWVDVVRSPAPVADQKIFQASYYEIMTTTNSADRADWPADAEFTAAVAKAPNDYVTSYDLYDNVAGEVIVQSPFTPTVPLSEDLLPHQTSFVGDLSLATSVYEVIAGGLAWINNELVEITSFDHSTSTFTVKRGLMDTVPTTHIAGSEVFVYDAGDYTLDEEVRVPSELVQYKYITKTGEGDLSLGNAPTESHTVFERMYRPYPPGNVQVNGSILPFYISGEFALTWSHRDRTQQLADYPEFTEGSIGPEAGVTYTLSTYDENDQLIGTQTALTGTAFTYDQATEETDLNSDVSTGSGIFEYSGVPSQKRLNDSIRFRLSSDRGGDTSWQTIDHTVERVGYGFKYGEGYGR